MEQFELNLESIEPTESEIIALYKDKIGIDPTFRGFSIEEMKQALENPDAERERIMELDQESDRDDISNTYRRS
jgi:hypothetical protein